MASASGPGTPGPGAASPRPVVVDLGSRQEDGSADPIRSEPPGPAPPRRRRAAYLAGSVASLLVVVANVVPRGESSPPGKAVEVRDRPLSVCRAVTVAGQDGGLPSKPSVLPRRATGYFTVPDRARGISITVGLTYEDGTVSLCRPVREPGTGSPEPRQRELPILGRGDTYAYAIGPSGLTLVGVRSADGTITWHRPDAGLPDRDTVHSGPPQGAGPPDIRQSRPPQALP